MAMAAGRLARPLYAAKAACDALAPLVREIYGSADRLVELKEDASRFTVADGLVQEMLVRHLFFGGRGFEAVVGEEDASKTNLTARPYTVSSLAVPEALFDMIDQVRDTIEGLGRGAGLDAPGVLPECTVFVDPIDGTKEFSSRLGEQCTILVGLAEHGRPVGGLVYRPIPSPASWALGAAAEDLRDGALDMDHALATTTTPARPRGLLTTNGAISAFTEALLRELSREGGPDAHAGEPASLRVCAGGAGNKVLNLLEGRASCYIQDRGVSRWDSCASQAVVEAYGGLLCQLHPFLARQELKSYTYRATEVNLDFEADAQVRLTKYNRRSDCASAELTVQTPEEIKPYANVCGLIALRSADPEHVDRFYELCSRAAAVARPSFD